MKVFTRKFNSNKRLFNKSLINFNTDRHPGNLLNSYNNVINEFSICKSIEDYKKSYSFSRFTAHVKTCDIDFYCNKEFLYKLRKEITDISLMYDKCKTLDDYSDVHRSMFQLKNSIKYFIDDYYHTRRSILTSIPYAAILLLCVIFSLDM